MSEYITKPQGTTKQLLAIAESGKHHPFLPPHGALSATSRQSLSPPGARRSFGHRCSSSSHSGGLSPCQRCL